MKILVTGAAGMVGRNIVEAIEKKGKHQILKPMREELDLEDHIAVLRYFTEKKPEAIIHTAGKVGGIQANMVEKEIFLSANLRIGLNVIESAKSVGVPRLLNLASSCMYPKHADNPLHEEKILTGELESTNEGYAIAKIASTKLCQYISEKEQHLQYKTLIPCNLYGTYDHFDPTRGHMIASVITRMHKAKDQGDNKIIIWGDGTARREFMFVGDFADFVAEYITHIDDLPNLMNIGLGFERIKDKG